MKKLLVLFLIGAFIVLMAISSQGLVSARTVDLIQPTSAGVLPVIELANVVSAEPETAPSEDAISPSSSTTETTLTNTRENGNGFFAITLFLSSNMAGSIDGVDFDDEDILMYTPDFFYNGPYSEPPNARFKGFGYWDLFFDGSAVGLAGFDVNAFEILPDYSILLSLQGPGLVPGVGRVDDNDIIRFTPDDMYSFGMHTSGTFELFLNGSDFGLAVGSADIDAITMLYFNDINDINDFDDINNGILLISVSGYLYTKSLYAGNQDLVALDPETGEWVLFFDGNANDLGSPFEHINAVSFYDGYLFMSSQAKFSVPGVSGEGRDVYVCWPTSFDPITDCEWEGPIFQGAAYGFPGTIDGLSVKPWYFFYGEGG